MGKKIKLQFQYCIIIFLILLFFSCQKNYEEKIKYINKEYKYLCNSAKNPLKETYHNAYDSCGISILYKKKNRDIDIYSVHANFLNDSLFIKIFEYLDVSISSKKLNFWHCEIKNTKKILSKFKDVKILSFGNAKIDTLKVLGVNFDKLTHLRCYNMNLLNISFGYLPSLHNLEFNNVNLKNFKIHIKNIPNIKNIKFGYTNIQNMEDLDLSDYPNGTEVSFLTTYHNKYFKDSLRYLPEFIKKHPEIIFYYSKKDPISFIYKNTIIKDSITLRKKYPNIKFNFFVGMNLIM